MMSSRFIMSQRKGTRWTLVLAVFAALLATTARSQDAPPSSSDAPSPATKPKELLSTDKTVPT